MNRLRPMRTGGELALIAGVFHFCCAIMIAMGIAQPLLNWVFRLHMITPPYIVEEFAPLRAVGLVIYSSIMGFVTGAGFAWVWNRMHRE